MEETNDLVLQHFETIGIPESLITQLRDTMQELPPPASTPSTLVELVSASSLWSSLVKRSSRNYCGAPENAAELYLANDGASDWSEQNDVSTTPSIVADARTREVVIIDTARREPYDGCYVSLADLRNGRDTPHGSSLSPRSSPRSDRCCRWRFCRCLCLPMAVRSPRQDVSNGSSPASGTTTCSWLLRHLKPTCYGICGQRSTWRLFGSNVDRQGSSQRRYASSTGTHENSTANEEHPLHSLDDDIGLAPQVSSTSCPVSAKPDKDRAQLGLADNLQGLADNLRRATFAPSLSSVRARVGSDEHSENSLDSENGFISLSSAASE